MRLVVGTRRRKAFNADGVIEVEDWVARIRRASREAERSRKEHCIPDWVEEVTRRQFRWAGHVARRDVGRWTKVCLEWALAGWRSKGRPRTRWSDSIDKYSSGAFGTPVGSRSWIQVAQDRETWKTLEDDYVLFHMRRKLYDG